MFCVFLLVLGFVTVLSQSQPPHPHYPEVFYSQWNWYESFVDGKGAEGPAIWAKNSDDRIYLNMTAIKTEQLIVNNIFYEWYTGTQNCVYSTFEYDLVEHWFDNTTLIDTRIDNNNIIPPQYLSVWIGSLYFNNFARSSFMVYVNETSGLFGSKYVAINIYSDSQNRPGSEVIDIEYIQYTLPNGAESLFNIPPFCTNENNVIQQPKPTHF